MGLLLQDHARVAVTDEALRKVYDEQIKPMGATEEVRARHILFRADPKDARRRRRRRSARAPRSSASRRARISRRSPAS